MKGSSFAMSELVMEIRELEAFSSRIEKTGSLWLRIHDSRCAPFAYSKPYWESRLDKIRSLLDRLLLEYNQREKDLQLKLVKKFVEHHVWKCLFCKKSYSGKKIYNVYDFGSVGLTSVCSDCSQKTFNKIQVKDMSSRQIYEMKVFGRLVDYTESAEKKRKETSQEVPFREEERYTLEELGITEEMYSSFLRDLQIQEAARNGQPRSTITKMKVYKMGESNVE